MYRSQKIKLILNNSMKRYLDKCFGYDRYVWNSILAINNELYARGIDSDINSITKVIRRHRKETKWENELPSYIINTNSMNICHTWKKNGKANFKTKKNKRDSFYIPADKFSDNSFQMRGNSMTFAITMSKKCRIPRKYRVMKLEELPKCKDPKNDIVSAVISKCVDGYYVSFCYVVDKSFLEKTISVSAIGIDPGIKSVMTLSTGDKIKFPIKKIKKLEQKIRFYDKQMSRKYKKGVSSKNQSNRYKRVKTKRAKLFLKITRIKTDLLHKITTNLVRTNSLIAYENCSSKKLSKNRRLSKYINSSCWYLIKKMFRYKSEMYGCMFELVDPLLAATQTCYECGNVLKGDKKLKLNDRVYKCSCGYVEDRDVNAAKNILKFAQLKLTETQPIK